MPESRRGPQAKALFWLFLGPVGDGSKEAGKECLHLALGCLSPTPVS